MLPVLSNYRAGSAPPESPLPSLPALPQSSPYPPGHHHTQCEWAGLDFHSNHQSGESCCIPLRELPEAPGTLYLKAVFLPAYMIQRCFIHSEVCLYAGNFWALIWSGVQSEGHEVCQNKGRKGTKTRKKLWKRKKKTPDPKPQVISLWTNKDFYGTSVRSQHSREWNTNLLLCLVPREQREYFNII